MIKLMQSCDGNHLNSPTNTNFKSIKKKKQKFFFLLVHQQNKMSKVNH